MLAWTNQRLPPISPCVKALFARLRSAEGFGLIELLVATVIMNIALLALLAAFTNGVTTAKRSARVATASTLADAQLELYRALTYPAIALDPSSVPGTGTTYRSDTAYSGSQITATCSGSVSSHPECNAMQTVTGLDHGTYEVDTYIVSMTPSNGRALKKVTVVVRDTKNVTVKGVVRRSSLFDQSTGT